MGCQVVNKYMYRKDGINFSTIFRVNKKLTIKAILWFFERLTKNIVDKLMPSRIEMGNSKYVECKFSWQSNKIGHWSMNKIIIAETYLNNIFRNYLYGSNIEVRQGAKELLVNFGCMFTLFARNGGCRIDK